MTKESDIDFKKQGEFLNTAAFHRLLLLAATVAYALSFSGDAVLHLDFRVFVFSAAGISFCLFGFFVLTFFVDAYNKNYKIISTVLAVAVLFHLTGLAVVNHFRPETLCALCTAVFIATFAFEKIAHLILFDVAVCGMLTAGIYLDYYISEQLRSQHVQFFKPIIDPLIFFITIVGAMIVSGLIARAVVVLLINNKRIDNEKPSIDFIDEPTVLMNSLSGKIIDCNQAAVNLFEVTNKYDLIDVPFDFLLNKPGQSNKVRSFKQETVIEEFVTRKGKIFSGVIYSKETEEKENISITVLRLKDIITEAAVMGKGLKYSAEEVKDISVTPSSAVYNSLLPVATVGLDYRFTEVNAAFCDLTGFTKSELNSIRFLDLIFHSDKDESKKLLSNLFRGRIPFNRSDKRMIRKNQQVVWVNILSSLQRNAGGFPHSVVCVVENIHKQKRYERSLLKDKSSLSSVVENTDFYIFTVDRNHALVYLSEKLKDILFGLTDIMIEPGYNLKQILPSLYAQKYDEIFQRGMNGESFVTEMTLEMISGHQAEIEVSVHPIVDEARQVISLVVSAKDISDYKKKERELLKEKNQAEQMTEAKSSFLATMSHEIRTPLNGVIGMSKLLSQTSLSSKQQDYLSSILLSGEALLTVINDILDYSKIESAKLELEYKSFALKRCVEETFELLSAKAIEKNLSLQYSISKEVPRYVVGDITRLRQVLLNLVSNAIKFTQRGKILIHIAKTSLEKDSIELLFEVRDTGIGIPSDKIDRLFKSFSQVDAGTAKTYGGTGLGLAISKNLVGLMGGSMRVKSTEGEGSSFFFTIKAGIATADEIPDGANGATQLANSKVLLISDDKEEINSYTNYFKPLGMTIRSTNNLETATQWIKTTDGIDLVAIDAQIVSAKAFTVAEKLRRLVPKERLPIILFNAVEDDITVDLNDKIFSAIIPKNIDRSKLLDILIGVFAIEDHQRSRQQKDMAATVGKRLAATIPLQILIAEDNAINQKLVANIFEGLGYKPEIVSNGLLVIEKLKRSYYDIIFMDVQMPEMDGLETTRYIIQQMNLSKRPVIIAMTAFALEGDRERCIEAGMDDYISKPFMIEEIVHSIQKWGKEKRTDTIEATEQQPLQTKSVPDNVEIEYGSSVLLPIINKSALERLKELAADNKEEFLRDVINMYLKQAPSLITELIGDFSKKKYVEMGQVSHKLKGSSLNLGATALAETCRKIEVKGRNNDPEGLEALIKELREIYEKTAEELRAAR